jgi:hypothetical protein
VKFGAPWSRELIIMSIIGSIALGVPVIAQLMYGFWLVPILLLPLLGTTVALCVRGYELAPGELRIRRLFWDTRWPLDASSIAAHQPGVMARSWRLWGNGGFFAFSGYFSNAALGRYRAFVTDFKRTVVITTQKGIVVVSPDRPEEFAAAIEQVRYSRTP